MTAWKMIEIRTAWGQEEWEKCHSINGNPFDLEEPYEWVAALEREGRIRGNVLDLGCGAGHNSIYLANEGYSVTGIDISSTAIARARQKASERGIPIELLQANVCEPLGYENRFDTVVDIGCFHSLCEEDHAKYAATLHRACRPGSAIFLRAFSNLEGAQEVAVDGKIFTAPSVSEDQLCKTFSWGWTIKTLEHKEIELGELTLTGKGKHNKNVWFARIEHD